MNNDRENRLRLLCIYELLATEANEDHPMSTNAIIQRLWERYQIKAHRITITKDISLIREAGHDVVMTWTRSYNYYLRDKLFQLPELKLVIDVVETAGFITQCKTESLVKKLTSLASVHQAEQLRRSLYNSKKSKTENELELQVVDIIHTAINNGKRLSFFYVEYNLKRRRVLSNDRKPFVVSPYQLVWDGSGYYLVAMNQLSGQICAFRVDYIPRLPEIQEEDALPAPEKFDLARFTEGKFRMRQSEEPVEVTLHCDAEAMKDVVDTFGPKVRTEVLDQETFLARVEVCASLKFFSWVFGMGGLVRIEEPISAVHLYQTLLEGQLTGEEALVGVELTE